MRIGADMLCFDLTFTVLVSEMNVEKYESYIVDSQGLKRYSSASVLVRIHVYYYDD